MANRSEGSAASSNESAPTNDASDTVPFATDGGAPKTGAAYVFRVTFSLSPRGVRADPRSFETVVEYPAPTPGESGWRFFRDYLWRGSVGDDDALRDLASEWLGQSL